LALILVQVHRRRESNRPRRRRAPPCDPCSQFLSTLHVYESLTVPQRNTNNSGQESSSDAATERAHTSQLPASSDDPSAGRRALRRHTARMGRLYERIGVGYTATRRADPRIAALIDPALGDAGTVVNVGAGAGGPRRLAAR